MSVRAKRMSAFSLKCKNGKSALARLFLSIMNYLFMRSET